MLLIILKIIFCLPYLVYKAIKDKKGRSLHVYGIEGYFGLPGKGKTMAMCHRLDDYRKKYGDNVLITTNFFYEGQDFPFTDWRQLLEPRDKPLIVAWDEIQNELNSRNFKDFPMGLMSIITQVRKNCGVKILYTAQRWHFVDKNFRSLSSDCWECNTVLGCFTFAKRYDPVDYDNLCGQSDYEKRRKIKPKTYVDFIQTDRLRNCYDSFKMLDSAKTKEYMDRAEINAINSTSNEITF